METRRLFDQGSAAYASARPRYPDALYRHLAGLCGQRRRAWDCATGTGQAALGLAQYFGEVSPATPARSRSNTPLSIRVSATACRTPKPPTIPTPPSTWSA